MSHLVSVSKFGCQLAIALSNVCIKDFFETCEPRTKGLQCRYVCLFMLLVFVLHSCLMIFS